MTNSFIPPRRTLMGPGPSDVSPRVLAALARPTIGHLDPELVRMMDELKAMLQNAFRTRNAKIVALVHAETSTGARSDAQTLCRIARDHDCLTIVDAVTSLGGVPLEVDAWGVDAVYSGTQKCLSCPPGISPVTMSVRAVDAVRKRNAPVQSWFLDLNLVMAYWAGEGARVYHHTAPFNALYGLHEALVTLEEEGLENSWMRHAREHAALRVGVEAMGLRFFVDEQARLPQLNSIVVPEGVVEADVRRALLHEFDLEIGAGLGAWAGKVWRVGLMGQSACRRNVLYFLSAMEAILGRSGAVTAARAAA